ncbi:ABC transporter permease [bacterium]|nr:ABC transporter permease [bacterium]
MQSDHTLPRWIHHLLTKMIPHETREGAIQDFEDGFLDQAVHQNRLSALYWIYRQILIMTFPIMQEKMEWSFTMLKSYLKMAMRYMQKQKLFSAINMLCLSIGLAACIMTLLYVEFELSHNRFHNHAEQIYRVDSKVFMRTRWKSFNTVPCTVGPALVNQYPEVEEAVRMIWPGKIWVHIGERKIGETNINLTDPSFFTLFNFKVIKGNIHGALNEPGQIVISESISQKYFGEADPVGQTLMWTVEGEEEPKVFTVTAVLEDAPANSYVEYGILAAYGPEWTSSGRLSFIDDIGRSETFIRLASFVDRHLFEEKLDGFQENHYPAQIAQKRKIWLRSMISILSGYGARKNMHFYSMMAVVILAIAIFNFINLSIARSMKRYREVGVRKVFGASRQQLFVQFIGESIGFTVGGLILGLLLVLGLMDWVNAHAGIHLSIMGLLNIRFIVVALGLTLLTGFFSGWYPAVILSRQRPVAVLGGRSAYSSRSTLVLGKILVILQFTVSSYFIGTGFVMLRQIHYMGKTDIGADLEDRISIELNMPLSNSKFTSIKDQLLAKDCIVGVACASNTPTSLNSLGNVYPEPFGDASEFDVYLQGGYLNIIYCDADYLKMMNMNLLEGDGFSPGDGQPEVILNDIARHSFEEGIAVETGMVIEYHTGDEVMKSNVVVGVVADFHYAPLRWDIDPLVLTTSLPPGQEVLRYLIVKPGDGQNASGLAAIREVVNKAIPECEVSLSFMSDEWQIGIEDERQVMQIGIAIALITAIISGLGLYGLAAFMLEQRVREVGIHKVLGARANELVALIGGSYLKWILLANVVALPLGITWGKEFLSDFAYRINMNGISFLAALFSTMLILCFSVGFKLIKTSRLNPVDTLKRD